MYGWQSNLGYNYVGIGAYIIALNFPYEDLEKNLDFSLSKGVRILVDTFLVFNYLC